MSNARGAMDELRDLLIALEAGEVDAAEWQQLARLLDTSAQARDAYVAYMMLNVQLETEFAQSPIVIDPAQLQHLGRPAPVPGLTPPSSNLRYLSSGHGFGNITPRRMLLVFLVLVWGGLSVWWFARRSAEAPPIAVQPVEHPAHLNVTVAHITKQHLARWGEADSPPAADGQTIPLIDGQKLELAAGLVEITFASTARVVLEGPATFVVRDEKEHGAGDLRRGVLCALVPEKAHGFTIHAPGATIVDRGTEFGLRVDESTEVQVFAGLVEVRRVVVPPAEPAVASSRATASPAAQAGVPFQLAASKAIRVPQGSGEVEQSVAWENSFVESRALLAGRKVVLDDDFSDGNPETNVQGTGSGFSAVVFRMPQNSIAEVEGAMKVHVVRRSRFPTLNEKMVYLTSRDWFPVEGAEIIWKFKGGDDSGNSLVLALYGKQGQGRSGIELAMRRPPAGRTAPTFAMTAWSQPGKRVEYIRAGGERDAPIAEPSLDWTKDIEIRLSLTRTGYRLAWQDSAAHGHTWTGTWSERPGFDIGRFGGDDGLAQLQLYPLSDPQVGSTIYLDRVIVTVPAQGSSNPRSMEREIPARNAKLK